MIIGDGKVLKLHQIPDNEYEVASRKTTLFREGNRSIDAVNIVAFMDQQLVVVREFRKQIDSWIYDLPAGKLEPNEYIAACADRELYEETGLRINTFLDCYPHTFPSVGMSDEQQALVFCTAIGEISTEHQDSGEVIEPLLISASELCRFDKDALIGTQLATIIGMLNVECIRLLGGYL